jgi:AcrR family transcriptional regulator
MSKSQGGASTKKKVVRAYSSPSRDQQADETRTRIVDAARSLFLAQGFDGTTIDAIAREAGVAAPTVYAAFRSKRGLVAEILDRARMGPSYTELVKAAHAEVEPEAKVRCTAAIARQVFDAERSEMDLLRGAGVVSPEFGDEERERNRYIGQKRLVDFLSAAGRLHEGLDSATARDVLYALTCRDLYRQLVVVRGWSSSKYESWLGQTLVTSLVTPEPSKAR